MGLSGNSVLDVAIGLSFVFFVLAILATALSEAVSSLRGWRSKALEKWLEQNLATSGAGAAKAKKAVKGFYEHPAVNGLTRNRRDGTAHKPSYIPSEHAVTALIDVGRAAGEGYEIGAETIGDITAAIEQLPDSPIKDSLKSALMRAGDNAEQFRKLAERWFDDAMDRLSGWYKRRVQLFLWLFGLAIAVALNVDALNVAQLLFKDESVRQIVASQAQSVSNATPNAGTAAGYLNDLPLPIGWGPIHFDFPGDLWAWDFALKCVGVLLTAAAVALGAPFWFETLSKLGSLRSTGPQPATSQTERS